MTGERQTGATPTHAQFPLNHVSTGYQKARINVFVNPAQRHQLDALSAEWGVSLVETVRRVLGSGLQNIMFPENA